MRRRAAVTGDSSVARPRNSLFGCLRTLCDHHGVALSLTPEALDSTITELEGLAAAEAALAEAGFAVRRVRLEADAVRLQDQLFPLLVERRQGGYVLIIGVSIGNGGDMIGVFDPEESEARARPWTPDLVARALVGEALYAVPAAAHAGRTASPVQTPAVPAHTSPPPGGSLPLPRNLNNTSRKRTGKRKEIMADIYADAFENILVHGGTVRIDLASYSSTEKTSDDRPEVEVTGRLVMPIEGFVRAFGGIGKVVSQMVEAGVIEPIKGGPPSPSTPVGHA